MNDLKSTKPTTVMLLAVLLVVLFVATGAALTRFQTLIQASSLAEKDSIQFYSRQFAMVVSDSDDPFWSSVYASALETARERDAYLAACQRILTATVRWAACC